LGHGRASAQNDLANPSSNMTTIPSGSFVIPMDSLNYYTKSGKQLFNVNAYGLILTILDNRTGIHWFIKAGKSKDGIDFTASMQQILPTSGSTASYNLRGGPMVIFPRDTTGIRTIINTFNAKVASSGTGLTKTKLNIYRTTASVIADQRYLLTQTPSIAILNDAGNGSIHTGYLTDVNAPTSNYSTLSGHTLMTGCYTIATQPHNASAVQANLDSIQKFLDFGGNFLAQCEGVLTYENFLNGGSTPGFFQTTEGITLDNTNTTLTYPNPDVAYNQFLGSFNTLNISGSYLQTWYLTPAGSNPASVFKNNGYITVDNGTPASGSHKYDHMSASAAKILPTSNSGSMMFFVGGHDFSAASGTDYSNGIRVYFNAVLTPCGPRTSCQSLFFDIDMSVIQTAPTCYSYGDTVTITVKTKDNGPSTDPATGVVVTDTIPSAWTFVSYSATIGTYNNSTGKWALPTMNYGDSGVLTLKVVAKSYTTKMMSATVYAPTYDQVTTNDTAIVTINPAPLANAGSNKSICTGKSTQIGATTVSGDTYSWTSSPTGFTSTSSNPTVSPTTTTTYSLTEANATSICSKSGSVTVTVNSLPAAAVAAAATICTGSSISIGAASVSGSTYSWVSSPAGFTSTSSNPNVSPAATTSYTITETNTNGCLKSNTITVTINPLPNASVVSNTAICTGNSLSIGVTSVPGDTYSWTSSPTGFTSTLSNPIVNPIVTTTYTLAETITATGCTKSNPVTVTVNALPAASIIANTAICSGASIAIGATSVSGSTYSWTSSPSGFTSTSSNPSVSPATTTSYTLTETNLYGCVKSNSVIITVNPLPAAAVASNTAICSGISVSIGSTSVAGSSYSWTSSPSGFASTSSNPTVAPSTSTSYTLTETNSNGCVKSNSITLTVNALPTASVIANTAICIGASSSIGGTSVAGSTYSWVSSPVGFTSTLPNPIVSPTVSTTYALTETNSNGCVKSNSVLVTVNLLPAAAVIGTDTICNGSSVSIGASSVAGSTYSWTSSPTGFISTSSNPSVSPGVTTTYTLTETSIHGCIKSNSVLIVVKPAPTPSISGDNDICEDSTAEIYTTAFVSGDSYLWTVSGGTIQSGQNTNTVSVKWGSAGTGIISVKETNTTYGCSTTVSKDVIINAKPGLKLITH